MSRRILRTLSSTATSFLLAGGLGLIGAGAVDLTSANPAGATTQPFTLTCTGIPVVGTLTLPGAVITGTLSPNPVSRGAAATLNNLKLQIKVKKSLATLAKGGKLGATVSMGATVAKGLPGGGRALFLRDGDSAINTK